MSDQEKFITDMYPAVAKVSQETGMSKELILTQAAEETGFCISSVGAKDTSNLLRRLRHRAKGPSFCLSLYCLCLMVWSGDGLTMPINVTGTFGPTAEISQSASTTDSNGSTQKPNLRDSYHVCLDASDGVTAKVLDCIGTEFTYQDARLNRTYRLLRSALPANDKVRLRDEERQWIAGGDAACKATANGGGTADLLNARSCSLDRTADRADALEKMADTKRDH